MGGSIGALLRKYYSSDSLLCRDDGCILQPPAKGKGEAGLVSGCLYSAEGVDSRGAKASGIYWQRLHPSGSTVVVGKALFLLAGAYCKVGSGDSRKKNSGKLSEYHHIFVNRLR